MMYRSAVSKIFVSKKQPLQILSPLVQVELSMVNNKRVQAWDMTKHEDHEYGVVVDQYEGDARIDFEPPVVDDDAMIEFAPRNEADLHEKVKAKGFGANNRIYDDENLGNLWW